MTFDPVFDGDAGTFYTGDIHVHPGYTGRANDPNDIAVIVFPESIDEIVPAQLPTANFLGDLHPTQLLSQTYPAVGYGVSVLSGGSSGGGKPGIDRSSGGTRRVGTWSFMSLSRDWIRFDMDEQQGCVGDSGAPNFLGDSSVVVGIGIEERDICSVALLTVKITSPVPRSGRRVQALLRFTLWQTEPIVPRHVWSWWTTSAACCCFASWTRWTRSLRSGSRLGAESSLVSHWPRRQLASSSRRRAFVSIPGISATRSPHVVASGSFEACRSTRSIGSFALRADRFVLSTDGWTDLEHELHASWRWWTVEELEATNEAVLPAGLANVVRDVAQGRPPSPAIELPWKTI